MFKLKPIIFAVSSIFLISSCNQGLPKESEHNQLKQKNISFAQVPVPQTDKEKRSVSATKTITVDGKKTAIDFHIIAKSGDKIGSGTYGLLYNKMGQPLKKTNNEPQISHKTDFTSLIPFKDKLFMISHFESLPAAMYLTELSQDNMGILTAVNTKNIDFSSVNGLWTPCSGTVTPWNTHLGSEEYEPDAAKIQVNGSYLKATKVYTKYKKMASYFQQGIKAINPYDYGWIPEVIILNDKGDVKAVKHYAMGRFSHELAYIMPDEKTVYLTDDGSNVGLFLFVADQPSDLSSGNLYAAKWLQRSNKKAGRADIQWINLGHGSNFSIRQALKKRISFNDLFDKSNIAAKGYTAINTSMGEEYLKLKPGMEELASRLESRRYAALKGATTELNKMEGITYNPDDNMLFLAISSIAKGMENNHNKGKVEAKYDQVGNNDINLSYNPCGAVYGLNILPFSQPHSTDGQVINSNYIVNSMHSVLTGEESRTIKGNHCSVWGIANPDNLSFIPATNTLLIAEDSKKGHQNDAIWAYQIRDKSLTRILTTPYGSESTSPYYYKNIGAYDYIMTVVQHPYGERDALTKKEDMINRAESREDLKAITGFIGPLPLINP